jgi:hypothetical protein
VTTPRAVIAERLAAALPATIRVEKYARNIDNPRRPTVMVRTDSVAPHPDAPTSHRTYTFTVISVTPKVDPAGPGDDQADETLEEVLSAIDTDDVMRWTRTARGTWLDTSLPAYETTVEVVHTAKKESTP